jgi:hypothetical protein
MKILSGATALACALFCAVSASAVPGRDADICLDATRIDHTSMPDDQTILFYMRGGKIWKNTLKTACPGLHAEHAFAQVIRGSEICSNRQMIQVINRETPCALGAFTLYSPAEPDPR